jgi:hypothetical protein
MASVTSWIWEIAWAFYVSEPLTLRACLNVGDAVAMVVASPKISLTSLRVAVFFFEYGILDLDLLSNCVYMVELPID